MMKREDNKSILKDGISKSQEVKEDRFDSRVGY